MDNAVLLVGGVIAYWLYSKANAGLNLQFIPLGASWAGSMLQIQLGIQNPTTGSLQFTAFAATATVNGNIIGNLSDFVPTLIAPNSQTPVVLNFSPNYIGLASDVLNEIANPGSTVSIGLRGTATVQGVAIPVNINFTAAL